MSKIESLNIVTTTYLTDPQIAQLGLSLEQKVDGIYKRMNFDSFLWMLAYIFTCGYLYARNITLIKKAISTYEALDLDSPKPPASPPALPEPISPVFQQRPSFVPSPTAAARSYSYDSREETPVGSPDTARSAYGGRPPGDNQYYDVV